MAALITIPTLPVRSSSLPHHRAATKEPEPTPWLPTRRVYTLREYLASCRESARGAKAADPLEEEEEDAETSDAGSFLSIPEGDDADFDSETDSDSDSSSESGDTLPSPVSPTSPASPSTPAPPKAERPLPALPREPKPQDPLEQYLARVCARWEDRGNGYMYGLFPKHPEQAERPWLVRYGEHAYVRAWYPVRVPGSNADFARHFWSWSSMRSMPFRELDTMGLEFISPGAQTSTIDFPRWDWSTPQEDDDYMNLLHYGSSETPSIRLLPADPDDPSQPDVPKTVSETLALADAARPAATAPGEGAGARLHPGNLREVRDKCLRAAFGRGLRRDWERLRRKELLLAGMLREMLGGA